MQCAAAHAVGDTNQAELTHIRANTLELRRIGLDRAMNGPGRGGRVGLIECRQWVVFFNIRRGGFGLGTIGLGSQCFLIGNRTFPQWEKVEYENDCPEYNSLWRVSNGSMISQGCFFVLSRYSSFSTLSDQENRQISTECPRVVRNKSLKNLSN
jgi:hypothetical protein